MAAASPQPASAPVPELHLACSTEPEFSLLCACCADREGSDDVARFARRGVRWKLLWAMADHHGVLPTLFRSLSQHGTLVPKCELDHLRKLEQLNARRALWLTNQLLRVAETFEQASISFIAYKGPVLSQLLYGEPSSRQFGDLDFLVRANDVPRALAAVRDLGYRSSLCLSSAQEKAYLSTGYEYSFDADFGRNLLEIKWQILPRFYAVPFDMDGLFSRATTVNMGGASIPSLAPEDLLLVLCAHAAKHGWEKLAWLADVALLCRKMPFDWNGIQDEAARLGIERILAMNLTLANKFLQARVPENVLVRNKRDQAVGRFVKTIAARVAAGENCDPTGPAYFYEFSRLRERLADRARFWWRLITTPGVGEWKTAPLQNPASPLYLGIRIYRLASKSLQWN